MVLAYKLHAATREAHFKHKIVVQCGLRITCFSTAGMWGISGEHTVHQPVSVQAVWTENISSPSIAPLSSP